MKKQIPIIIIILIILLILVALFSKKNKQEEVTLPSTTVVATTTVSESITTNISADTKISSPLSITGSAPGSWYFEASFPITLVDGAGNILAQGNAQATSDWMVTGPVPFKATLTFKKPTTANGAVIFHNDNPSGDPARDKSFTVPVNFDLSNSPAAVSSTKSSIVTDVKIGPTGK